MRYCFEERVELSIFHSCSPGICYCKNRHISRKVKLSQRHGDFHVSLLVQECGEFVCFVSSSEFSKISPQAKTNLLIVQD